MLISIKQQEISEICYLSTVEDQEIILDDRWILYPLPRSGRFLWRSSLFINYLGSTEDSVKVLGEPISDVTMFSNWEFFRARIQIWKRCLDKSFNAFLCANSDSHIHSHFHVQDFFVSVLEECNSMSFASTICSIWVFVPRNEMS
jgi:hypothetical protein